MQSLTPKTPKPTARVSAHTHVKGLGLTKDGMASADAACGLVGQHKAREAAGVLLRMIRAKKMAGKSALLAGPPSSGKTALALALARELGARTPFCAMSGSDVFSSEVKKTAALAEGFRRAIGVRVRERKEVYEGEVTEIRPLEAPAPGEGYARAISAVSLSLKTTRGTRTLRLDPAVYEGLQRERVEVGDVVHIEGNSGAVKRVGRSDAFATEFDLEADEYVPVPKGDVQKHHDVVQDVTLQDLDAANARPEGGNDLVSFMSQTLKTKKTEMTERLRKEVNEVVARYVKQGIAEVVPGVLFIDEVHMLDVECFSFLNRALEDPLAPFVIFASNRGNCLIRGSDTASPHGIPLDLLDRTMVIRTEPYGARDTVEILKVKAAAEGVALADEALAALAKAAVASSLRYALQLIAPASILAEAAGEAVVGAAHVAEAKELFWDCLRSARRLGEGESHFLG